MEAQQEEEEEDEGERRGQNAEKVVAAWHLLCSFLGEEEDNRLAI